MSEQSRVNVFISYSHKDKDIKEMLCAQLATLKKQNIINTWSDSEIPAGGDIDLAIKEQILKTDVFILLISPDFLNSFYCIEEETKEAIKRHQQKKSIVIPCICRECVSLKGYAFEKLKRVPNDGKPITKYRPREAGCIDAIKQIQKEIERVFFQKKSVSVDTTKVSQTNVKRSVSKKTVSNANKSLKKPRVTSASRLGVNSIGIVLYHEGVLDTISIDYSYISALPEFYKNVSDLNEHLKYFTKDAVKTYRQVHLKNPSPEPACFKIFLMEICNGIRRYITDSAGVRVHFRGDNGDKYVGIIASSPDKDDDREVDWHTKLTPIPKNKGLIYHSINLNAPLLKTLNKQLNYQAAHDDLWPEYYTEALSIDHDVILSLGISIGKEQYKQKKQTMYFLTMSRFGDLIKNHINRYITECTKINNQYDIKKTIDALMILGG